eukprot:NODE_374_length_2338_cov_25.965924_g348_i0.p1 GENE.NODE_374_length_2338_cov_25.965924_g348_i0~~NODE_374_length_2338_cov_25.965924_g348_i0.p1  ORF type:complete len:649 (+),score=127.06 NODE_374_length_2338_cov_25.965924_g348_i0:166-1947(+)
METAHRRGAVTDEKFYFRRHINPRDACGSVLFEGLECCCAKSHSFECHDQFSMNDIVNGKAGAFPGLVPLVHNYLNLIECHGEARSMLNSYLDLIAMRASGELWTTAKWMRSFIQTHPQYKNDSIVSKEIAADLLQALKVIGEGTVCVSEMFGNLYPHKASSPALRKVLVPDLPDHLAPVLYPVRAKGVLTSSFADARGNISGEGLDLLSPCCLPEDEEATTYPVFPRAGTSRHLKCMLEELRSFHPQFCLLGGSATVCNHTYMVLHALYQLGAPSELLKRWFDSSVFEPIRPDEKSVPVTTDNWREQLGKGSFLEMRAFFEAESKRLGRDQLLREYVPVLILAVSRACFHPVIRLSYSLLEEGDGGVVDSLTYWSLRYGPHFDEAEETLAASKVAGRGATIPQALAMLRVELLPIVDRLPAAAFDALEWLLRLDKLQAIAARLDVRGTLEEQLGELVAYTARLFIVEQSFLTLHSITGLHALLQIAKYIPEHMHAGVFRLVWIWWCGVYTMHRCPELAPLGSLPATAAPNGAAETKASKAERWEKVRISALDSVHVHLIKVVCSCWHLSKKFPDDPIFLAICEQQIASGTPF